MGWFRWMAPRRRPTRNRTRLVAELLEDRTTPTTFTWTGSVGGNWNNAGNWNGGIPSGAVIDLVFPTGVTSTAMTNDLPGGTIIRSLTFQTGGYSLAGGALTFSGSIAANQSSGSVNLNVPLNLSAASGAQGIQVSTGGSLLLNQTITSAGAALNKVGGGALVVSGNNNGFTRGFTVQAGTLRAGSASSLGSSNTVTVGALAATLDFNDVAGVTLGSLAITDGSATTGTGSTGSVTVGSLSMTSGTLTIGSAAENLTLTGNISATSNSNGRAFINGPGNLVLPAGAHTLSVADGPLPVDLRIVAPLSGAGTITKTGSGRLEIVGANSTDATITLGDLETNDASGSLGDITLNGGSLSGTALVGAITGPGGGAAIGTIDPGSNENAQPGPISAGGNFVFGAQTTFSVDLATSSNFDFIDTFGSASLEGALLTGTTGNGVNIGDVFDILQAASISGRFFQSFGGSAVAVNDGDMAFIGSAAYRLNYVRGVSTQEVRLTRIAFSPASSTITLGSSANPAVTGDAVTFTATVTGAAGQGTPAGTVTFLVDGNAQATASLTGGKATFTTSALSAGLHRITASYSGETRFRPSATVDALSQTITSSRNGVVATAMSLGSVGPATMDIDQAIVNGTDVQVFGFTVSAGQVIRFNLTREPGSSLDSFLRLLDASGNQLAFNDDGPTPGKPFSRDSSITFRFERAGTYFIAVSGFPNYRYNPVDGAGVVAGTTGAYGLSIFVAPPERDDNDQLREAKNLGLVNQVRQVRDFVIGSSTDVDMFRFTVTAGQRLTIAVTRSAGSSLASLARLFNAQGKQVARSVGRDAVLTFTFQVGGTYYVGVSGQGNASYDARSGSRDRTGSVGAYLLTIAPTQARKRSRLDAAPRPVLPRGAEVSGLVYFDQSGDGVRQSGEIGVGHHTIILDRNNNGVRDDGEAAGLSNGRGQFAMTGLPAGRVPVFAEPLTQFGIPIEKITGPQRGFYVVQVSARKRVLNLQFGMSRYEA